MAAEQQGSALSFAPAPRIQRNSGIELLRIISMLQILVLHASLYGEYKAAALAQGGLTKAIAWGMQFMCRCPVFVFIIITGYFSCYSEQFFPLKKLLKIYLPMLFYAVAFPVAFWLTGAGDVSRKLWAKAPFPFLSRTWYFLTLYLLIMILSPFLNRMIRDLTKRQFLLLLGVLFLLYSVWQPMAKLAPFNLVASLEKIIMTDKGKSLGDFLFMYLIGAYLRRFGLFGGRTINRWLYLLAFVAFAVMNVLILYLFPRKNLSAVLQYNDNPLSIAQGVCLFQFFNGLTFHSRFINRVSACNLGVYMVHEHPLMRTLIWSNLVDVSSENFFAGPYLLTLAGVVIAIYVVCALVEYGRQTAFDWTGRAMAYIRGSYCLKK